MGIPLRPSSQYKIFHYVVAYPEKGTFSANVMAKTEADADLILCVRILTVNDWDLSNNSWGEFETMAEFIENVIQYFNEYFVVTSLCCPVCESSDLATNEMMRAYFNLDPGIMDVVECQECGHIHIEPVNTPSTPLRRSLEAAAKTELASARLAVKTYEGQSKEEQPDEDKKLLANEN